MRCILDSVRNFWQQKCDTVFFAADAFIVIRSTDGFSDKKSQLQYLSFLFDQFSVVPKLAFSLMSENNMPN